MEGHGKESHVIIIHKGMKIASCLEQEQSIKKQEDKASIHPVNLVLLVSIAIVALDDLYLLTSRDTDAIYIST